MTELRDWAMRIFTRTTAVLALLLALFLVGAPGSAQAAPCDRDDPYCSPDTPDEIGGSDDGGGVEIDVPVEISREDPADPIATSAPTGSLPFTGGDVVGMTVIGAIALGVGALLVHRSKAMRNSA